ncbi:MAG: rhodanese-like domain-containing protein [Pirellulaceae bacterium]|nr:rhodanese-like domain-containing protein [Pirellulaceae bacterium]
MSYSQISPQELVSLKQSNPDLELIDVRTPAEFGELHVDFARNVPLDRLDVSQLKANRNGHAGRPLYVVCRSGGRSKMACEKLVAAGFDNIVDVAGGTQACEAAGLPVVRGAKVMSLERQVRVAAGLLVLLGAALGFGIHPGFYGLSAFVGAGLVFAGITDTCAMGMLIARLPWNQRSSNTAACSR